MFVKRKEEMSELESARLSHSVASKQPARPQDNIRAQRNNRSAAPTAAAYATGRSLLWTNVIVFVVASVFALMVPRRMKHSTVAWVVSTDSPNLRDVSAMSITECALMCSV